MRIQNRSRGQRAPQAGFTLVEVMVSLVILVIAGAGYSAAIVSTAMSAETTRETRAATEAAWSVMEALQGSSFEDVYSLYNQDPGDDPDGDGTAPGTAFECSFLTTVEGDADGQVGEIILPGTANALGLWELREDAEIPELGLPRDLNGDGDIDDLDHSDDYIILPVLVRMNWQGTGSASILEFRTTLSGV